MLDEEQLSFLTQRPTQEAIFYCACTEMAIYELPVKTLTPAIRHSIPRP